MFVRPVAQRRSGAESKQVPAYPQGRVEGLVELREPDHFLHSSGVPLERTKGVLCCFHPNHEQELRPLVIVVHADGALQDALRPDLHLVDAARDEVSCGSRLLLSVSRTEGMFQVEAAAGATVTAPHEGVRPSLCAELGLFHFLWQVPPSSSNGLCETCDVEHALQLSGHCCAESGDEAYPVTVKCA